MEMYVQRDLLRVSACMHAAVHMHACDKIMTFDPKVIYL